MSHITKLALEQSLKNLLTMKPANKITVTDIAEDCGISRMTFYYHFKDVYDLIEWSCEEDARKALNGKKTYNTWQQGYLQIFEAVRENRVFITNVYHNVDKAHIETYLYRVTYKLLEDVLHERAVNRNVKEEDIKFIANFYKYAFVGLLLDWIKEDMKEDPEQIIHRLEKMIHGNFNRALETFEGGGF